jgi:hypothetical protein
VEVVSAAVVEVVAADLAGSAEAALVAAALGEAGKTGLMKGFAGADRRIRRGYGQGIDGGFGVLGTFGSGCWNGWVQLR